jgi:metallo-beta-lactamase family protein
MGAARGGRVDATRIARLHRWRRVLDCAEQANGRVLVPAFAMQRTQDVLFDLHDLFAEDGYAGLQVFLDSPMAERVNEVFAEYMLQWDSASSSGEQFVWLGQQLFRRFRLDPHDAIDRELASWMVGEVLRPDGPEPRLSWRAANRKAAHALPSVRCWRRIYTSLPPGATVAAGSVVVAGSGMCTGGRILTHLERHLDDSNAAVVFAGYAGPHTLAGQLQRAWSERGHTSAADQPIAWPDNEPRRITRLPQIRAAALRIPGYSGHADGPNLASYVFDVPGAPVIAPRVFLTHGDDQARHCLRAALIRLARKRSTPLAVEVPDHTSAWFDLDRDSWCHDDRFADPHACA